MFAPILELKPDPKLHVSRRIQRARHLPKSSIAERSIWEIESWRVREVEELTADLYLHVFANGEYLTDGEIRVMNSIAT